MEEVRALSVEEMTEWGIRLHKESERLKRDTPPKGGKGKRLTTARGARPTGGKRRKR